MRIHKFDFRYNVGGKTTQNYMWSLYLDYEMSQILRHRKYLYIKNKISKCKQRFVGQSGLFYDDDGRFRFQPIIHTLFGSWSRIRVLYFFWFLGI